MSRPTVSVVIPCYNCAQYVEQAIQSALGQQGVEVEVIVVNDGSPDNVDEVVRPYRDRITYIKQDNRGLSAARNVGFRASTGDFIGFLDADDILLLDKFVRQLAVFEQEPDLGVVISGYIDVEEDGHTEIQAVRKHWHRDALEHLLNHEVFPPHAPLTRREVLEKSRLFPEDIDTAESQEDWQLWLDLALDGVQFSSVPEPTCKYRRRPGSISADPLKHLDGARRVVQWLRQDPRTQPHRDRVERLAAIVEMEQVARAWQVGRTDIAAETLLAAVQQFPAFWQEPRTFVRLFERTLTHHEQARWQRLRDPAWFEQRLIDEVLSLGRDNLSQVEMSRLYAAAYLALSDLAYGDADSQRRRRAFMEALRNSVRVCVSASGRASLVRGLMGPDVIRQARRAGKTYSTPTGSASIGLILAAFVRVGDL